MLKFWRIEHLKGKYLSLAANQLVLLTWLINLTLYGFRRCNAVLLVPSFPSPQFSLFLHCLLTTGNLQSLCRLLLRECCDASFYPVALFSESCLFHVVRKNNFSKEGFSQILNWNKTWWVILWPLLPLYNSSCIHYFCLSWTWPKPTVSILGISARICQKSSKGDGNFAVK